MPLTLITVEGTVAGRIENLRPWPNGVSGNPGGRPKRDQSDEIAQAVFESNPEAIYKAMLRALKKGNPRAFDVLAVRAYGKVKEQIELSASPGIAERLEAARRRLDETTDSELKDGRPVLEGQLQLEKPAGDADGTPQD
jgi:hypothetical protein